MLFSALKELIKLKGKLTINFTRNGQTYSISGDFSLEDIYNSVDKAKIKNIELSEHQEKIPADSPVMDILKPNSLPTTKEIKEFIEHIPPTQRTISVVSAHYCGRPLTAKNRRLYGLFYERLKRANKQLDREVKTGIDYAPRLANMK